MSHFSELLSRGQDPLNVSVSISHNCYLHEVSRVGYHRFDMAGEEIKADWVRRVSGLQDKARVKTKNSPLHCSRQSKAPHSSVLAWRSPWTEEPGRLQSMGSKRIGHS